MGIDQFEIVKYPSLLLGLSGETTMAYGSINLAVKAGTVTRVTEFLVVDRPASYNIIMGTPRLNAMRAIPSTYHLCLKFPTPNRIEVIWGNPRVSQVCYAAEQKRKRPDLETIPRKTEKKVSDQAVRKKQPLASREVARDASRITSSKRRKRTLRQKMMNILTHILRKNSKQRHLPPSSVLITSNSRTS
ncbi:hypothetical protein F2Q69_00047609 [Brassica cretica]|uniref:Uncharacterized protein n=1 Tax=Brassica cretica TaxID=69181 RepID=A0A8S9Q2E8_BRACR|nr:hypothetical protein F2Q69_00047609 [Brassica cretica]